MPKKGETNNPHGRPKKPAEEKYITPKRQLGRVPDDVWEQIKAGVPKGLSFTEWAISILLKAAKKRGRE